MLNLKNNEERKEWLRHYRDWGVWYKDEHIGATYYRYIFENGAQLIVDEYYTPPDGIGNFYIYPGHTDGYYHLIQGPHVPVSPKWANHVVYDRYPDCETELLEFLKYVGKEEKNKD